MEKKFSDEFLNAFVDDQLAPEEKSRAYEEINRDETLNRQVCELRKVRDLVQLAYKEVPAAPAQRPAIRRVRLTGVAAGLTMVLGVAIGWLLHGPVEAPAPVASKDKAQTLRVASDTARPVSAATPRAVPATSGAPAKVLIHINEGDRAHLEQALAEIEGLANFYRASHNNARIEVVLNGDGLNLVRVDTTAFAARIARLQQVYDNVVFEACQNTIDRLKRDAGIVAQLLPGVVVIDSGVVQIQRRQHQGWAYIQV